MSKAGRYIYLAFDIFFFSNLASYNPLQKFIRNNNGIKRYLVYSIPDPNSQTYLD